MTGTSDTNTYLFDLKNIVYLFLKHNSHSTFFIDQKEYNRIRYPNNYDERQKMLSSFPSTIEDYDYFFAQHDSLNNESFILTTKLIDDSSPVFSLFQEEKAKLNYNKVLSLHNRRGTVYSIYQLNNTRDIVFSILKQNSNDKLKEFIRTSTLKSFNLKYNTFVFQKKDSLFWLVGSDEINEKTEIIFHLHTNRPDLLPKNRIKYGFDNLGFKASNSLAVDKWGIYRVFKKKLPSSYKIGVVKVGINLNGTIVRFNPFLLSDR